MADAGARVLSRADAQALVDGVLAVMAELQGVLEAETAHVRVGRIREGLAEEARKGELSAAYLRALEGVKANAVALARFAPEALDRLKAAHGRFGAAVQTNQTVLATARAVCESLVRSVSAELNRSAQPQVYAPAGRTATAARSEPLLVSRRL